jgi:hypothetical protein
VITGANGNQAILFQERRRREKKAVVGSAAAPRGQLRVLVLDPGRILSNVRSFFEIERRKGSWARGGPVQCEPPVAAHESGLEGAVEVAEKGEHAPSADEPSRRLVAVTSGRLGASSLSVTV